ncbi:long-chain-fatty-acid--CoA ligase [Ornithinimicrobium humiphilum]|uniref:Long-chain acyl-CoA synthetase n=1 Tax=Ornithinimicrobium humiphilum TaxID=125288 RepID=A0A543K7H7_9MICO|nr:AMP-binding protein [Ornithinimicrobium humiphilum]TQM91015.1 long-chain acyl-CoA synthetase [Ornithinimicrobium humiphilum]
MQPNRSAPTPLTVEPAPTTSALLAGAARRWPERVAMDFLGATTTYAELAAQVDAAARVLADLGVGPGDRVALVLPNCPQHVVAFYATHALGATVAEHNPLAAPEEVRAQLDRHGAKVVVAWEHSVATVAPEGDTLGRTVLAVDLTAAMPRRSRFLLRLPLKAARAQRAVLRASVPETVGSWDGLVAAALKNAPAQPAGARPGPSPEDVAVLLPTGGTTGTPKLVPLTHANLTANVAQGRQWVPGLEEGEETFGSVLPFFHAFGLTLCLTFAVSMGATQVILPRFDVDLVLAATKRRPLTFLAGVPPMLDRLEAAARERDPDRLRTIRFAISGAMALDPEVAARWEATTGGLVIEGYGMTESSPVLLGNPFGAERRPGALGLPFPGTEIRIVDPEAVEEDPDAPDVPDGEVGELLARGPQVFGGYLEDPEDSAQVLLPGGWLRTGDLVRRDPEDGFVVLADRRKELIVSGGFNVYPSQVEDAVREMPGVVDVAVVGLPDSSLGERAVAALVLEPGATVELEALRTWLYGKVSRYALPNAVHVLEELPRSQLGKVLRRHVREHLLERGRGGNVGGGEAGAGAEPTGAGVETTTEATDEH